MKIIHRQTRNLDRISNVIPFGNVDCWVDVELKTKIITRIVSREFNIISVYMRHTKSTDFNEIKRKIEMLELQIFHEEQFIKSLDMPKDLPISCKWLLNLRLISAWNARYYRCLVKVDDIFFTLAKAEFNNQILNTTRTSKMKNLLDMIVEIKKTALVLN